MYNPPIIAQPAPVAPNLPPPMVAQPPLRPPTSYTNCCNIFFYIVILILEVGLIALFYTVRYPAYPWGVYRVGDINWYYYLMFEYKIMADLSIMMLVGYGFLVSYLRFHRWMSLTLTFFIVMISLQYYILFYGFWTASCNLAWFSGINMTITTIIMAQKAAITVLISIGALIGKVDFFQMTIFALFELIVYSLNEAIIFRGVGVLDQGGSMYIHCFGALFGIFASWIYSPKSNMINNPNNRASYGSATVTFIGTFFLWIFFPSFNAYNYHHSYLNPSNYYTYMSPIYMDVFPHGYNSLRIPHYNYDVYSPLNYNLAFLGISNTYWALLTSTAVAFWMSMIVKGGKFSIDHILNATLAGGVMIGACCDMFAFPYPALLVGAFAGIVSVLSFQYLSRCLEAMLIFDTRGVFHLHFIPGMFGCIASAIAVATMANVPPTYDPPVNYFGNPLLTFTMMPRSRLGYIQGGYQIIGGLISMGMGIAGGLIMGWILRIWRCMNLPEDTFGDHIFFKMIQENQLNGPAPVFTDKMMNPPPLVVQPGVLY